MEIKNNFNVSVILPLSSSLVKSFEDLLKLPVNEEYARNQLKRQEASKNLKSLNITKEDE
jgi:hypothetical protein